MGIAVWLSNPRLEPFIIYGDALRAHGLPELFPHAYDTSANSMSVQAVTDALLAAGFIDVDVITLDLELAWPDADAAARAVAGTPYGPTFAALDPSARRHVMADLVGRMTGDDGTAIRHRTTAVLAHGHAA